jgi:excisionase family DNA binding protein
MVSVVAPEETLGLERLPPTLTVEQTAILLGVSRQTIYRAVEAGEMRGLKVRGRLVVSTAPLIEAMGW